MRYNLNAHDIDSPKILCKSHASILDESYGLHYPQCVQLWAQTAPAAREMRVRASRPQGGLSVHA